MLTHSIGEVVKLKDNLSINHNFFTVTDSMFKFSGCTATILGFVERDIFDTNPDRIIGYRLNIDDGLNGWEDSMFSNK